MTRHIITYYDSCGIYMNDPERYPVRAYDATCYISLFPKTKLNNPKCYFSLVPSQIIAMIPIETPIGFEQTWASAKDSPRLFTF